MEISPGVGIPGSLPWLPKLAVSCIRNTIPPWSNAKPSAQSVNNRITTALRQMPIFLPDKPGPHISSNRVPLAAPPRDVDDYADDPQRAPHRPQGSLVTLHIPQRQLCPL